MTGYKNDAGKLEYQIGVYYVSKSNFGIGQKVDDYTDFSFLKKSNFDGFIEKVKRLQLSQEEIEKLKEHREQEINASLVKLNNDIYQNEKGLSERDRVYLVAASIIATLGVPGKVAALEKSELKSSTEDGNRDGDIILRKIKAFLNEKNLPQEKRDRIVRTLQNTLTTDNINKVENGESQLKSLKWDAYNLEKLFGKSTRGKRLKGDDRIAGTLPFVTAGEAAEGISAYISNKVEVFEKNATTIDMFGSAKYRNYQYGADDHAAVVHTEAVPMKASIFVTSAIHKAAHTGKFDYGHNFYAKDAYALDILLPTKDGKPDFEAMEILISAIQKLVIKDVVLYADRKIEGTKEARLTHEQSEGHQQRTHHHRNSGDVFWQD